MITCLLLDDDLEREREVLAGVLCDEASRFEINRRSDAVICYLDLGVITTYQHAVQRGQHLGRSVRTRVGVAPAIGVAGSKFPAYAMAAITAPSRLRVIPAGTEAAVLAPLPVGLLPLDAEMARRLRLLGIQTLGQFAALPVGAVLNQFGTVGRRLHRWACGHDDRPVTPYQPEQMEREYHRFDDPVVAREVVEAVLRRLVAEVTARLREQNCMTRALHLCITLEDETQVRRSRAYTDGVGDESRLARALCRLLAATQVDCGIVAIEVTLGRLVAATGEQLTLFTPEAGHADTLREVLPALVERYGNDRFRRLQREEADSSILERRIRDVVRTI